MCSFHICIYMIYFVLKISGAGGLRGATPHSRSGGAAVRRYPLVQGKEQWLRFAGAAVKRYPMPKVRETQVRW